MMKRQSLDDITRKQKAQLTSSKTPTSGDLAKIFKLKQTGQILDVANRRRSDPPLRLDPAN